jgi:hypothetical protein
VARGQIRQPALWASGLGRKKEAKGAGPSGRKLRMEKTSISFSFSNISNAFSNSFCNPFLLEIKTNQS